MVGGRPVTKKERKEDRRKARELARKAGFPCGGEYVEEDGELEFICTYPYFSNCMDCKITGGEYDPRYSRT